MPKSPVDEKSPKLEIAGPASSFTARGNNITFVGIAVALLFAVAPAFADCQLGCSAECKQETALCLATANLDAHTASQQCVSDAADAAIEIDEICIGDWSDERDVVNAVDAYDWYALDDEAEALVRGAADEDAAVAALLEREVQDGTYHHPVVEDVLGYVRYIRDH